MNEVIINLVLDSVMAALLVVTIIYCFKLNNRIRILQDSKSEFSKLIAQFDQTTNKAQQSIAELQQISSKVNAQLSEKLDKANFLADDLAFMIERGGKLAAKMETESSKQPLAAKRKNAVFEESDIVADSKLKVAAKKTAGRKTEIDTAAMAKERKRVALENVLNRANEKRKSAPQTAAVEKKRRSKVTTRLRSKAEQELYEAIKSGN